MADQFTWISFYKEFAAELSKWEARQRELIQFLEELRAQGCTVTPLQDKLADGSRLLATELDPFTFFGVFNRTITDENRIEILHKIKARFGIQAAVPSDFNGVPILNNQKSWFVAYASVRGRGDVSHLWRVFKLAQSEDPMTNSDFKEAFDQAQQINGVHTNLTMGLFWIRPKSFINLDRVNRDFLDIKLPKKGITSDFYLAEIRKLQADPRGFPQISLDAFQASAPRTTIDVPADANCWFVGAMWDGTKADQTQQFIEEGVWRLGYQEKFTSLVKEMAPGDVIAIKAACTQKRNLPFKSDGSTQSKMIIKAIGSIIKVAPDGRSVDVDWVDGYKSRDWYFYTSRTSVWKLRRDKPESEQLVRFAFQGQPQDYAWFLKNEIKPEEPPIGDGIDPEPASKPYGIANILASGAFLEEPEIQEMIDRLRSKKNIILQGPPGVGKTYLARKLAYAFIEEEAPDQVGFVQFHQSFSYDDFVRGWRPGKGGTFDLQDAVFHKFCEEARQEPGRDYVFIIDEINRGNLSQIFGELMMLIEADKRGEEHAVRLVYRQPDEPPFYVPENVHIIGLMNIADRSLALVDYALRRRFAFLTLSPKFNSSRYRQWLTGRRMASDMISLIIGRMNALNEAIASDGTLGRQYQIGHSFLCPMEPDCASLGRSWYDQVVRTEIAPLLREYWFDNPTKAKEWEEKLLA